MTENKRFQYNVNKNCIEYDDNFVAYVNSIDGFRIANKLNCLEKENEQLKKENKELRSDREYWKTLAQSLARTNGNVKDEHLAWKRVDVE